MSCKLSKRVLKNSESNLSVESLYLIKIITLILVSVVILPVRYTNVDVFKKSIISKQAGTLSLFQKNRLRNYSYNFILYNSILDKIGMQTLKRLDYNKKVEAVKRILPGFVQSQDKSIIEEKAVSFVDTYDKIARIRLFDWKIVLIIIISFWLPEMFLFLKKVLMGSMYKKEVIKLENIFELLGSIRGFKTIDIIEEMSNSSRLYKNHLINCMEMSKTDKKLALELLKSSVNNNRFSKLADVLRVYSSIDKNLALKIMERNRLEKEEEIILTAEEDLDVIDIIAFISIAPILLELSNLLMKPMLDMIYEAFRFI